jgi:hypothetical protein
MRRGIEEVVGRDGATRNETALQRMDRNLVELSAFQRLTYFATLLAAGAAAILLIAPTA